MELPSIRQRLAVLLERLAQAAEFDEQEYIECENLLGTASKDKLLGIVSDERAEYYAYWHGKTLWGKPSRENGELEWLRSNLRLFAQALRENITEFRSLEDLRSKVEQAARAHTRKGSRA